MGEDSSCEAALSSPTSVLPPSSLNRAVYLSLSNKLHLLPHSFPESIPLFFSCSLVLLPSRKEETFKKGARGSNKCSGGGSACRTKLISARHRRTTQQRTSDTKKEERVNGLSQRRREGGLLRPGIVVASLALQSGAVYRSQGFEGNVLGNSSGWWAATVATYCQSRLVELPKNLSSKPCDR